MGRLFKTDRIDAEGLAEFGRVLLSRDDLARYLKPLASDAQQDLTALGERQRLRRSRRAVRRSIKVVIKTSEPQLDRADHDMNGHVKVHFAALDQLLRSTCVFRANLTADPVFRLAARDRCTGWGDHQGEGRPCPVASQPDAVRARVSAREPAREPGDGL